MAESPIASIRLSDPNQTRIHTVNYELTDEERVKAGNNDYQIRGTVGFGWPLAEKLRLMPYGTPELDALWRAYRDELDDELLEPFCAMCEGAGMSYRTLRNHPHEYWERYQKAGLRISSDRSFNTKSLSRYGFVNSEVHRIDLENFEKAADFAAEGYPDDDYNAPPSRSHARVIPSIPQAIMPDFGGDLLRDYLAAGWRTTYDAVKDTAGFDPGVLRNWCAMNVLAILDDRNFDREIIIDNLKVNIPFTAQIGADFVADFNTQFRASAFNAFTATFPWYFWYAASDFSRMRSRGGVYLTDAADPHDNQSDDVPWVDTAERDRRLDQVDAILGDATPRV